MGFNLWLKMKLISDRVTFFLFIVTAHIKCWLIVSALVFLLIVSATCAAPRIWDLIIFFCVRYYNIYLCASMTSMLNRAARKGKVNKLVQREQDFSKRNVQCTEKKCLEEDC